MTHRTIAYMRVSTAAQLEGAGIDQQRASIITWAVSNGVAIDEYITEDETGTTEDREEIRKLQERARNGEFSVLIIDRVDRLGRTLAVCETLFAAFKQLGVDVRTVGAVFDDSPAGRMLRQVMGVLAEYQRSEWLGRMKQCRKAAAAKKGTSLGGRSLTGYRSVGRGQLAADDRSAAAVARCFALRETGCSLSDVARALAAEGFRNTKDKPYAVTQVARILARADVYRATAHPHASSVQLAPGVMPAQPALI